MYFLFSTVLTASFLVYAELSAVCFVLTLLFTVLFLYLFSVYFRCCTKTVVFMPLVTLSLSMHIVFFLLEQTNKYIKNVSIWVLCALLLIVCGFMCFGNRKISGINAVTLMSGPVFFLLAVFALISVLGFKTAQIPLWSGNLYQYIFTFISPPSTALALNFMHRCRFKKIWPAFVSSVLITVCFSLFDSAFFKNLALTFIAPFIISAEMLLIKETFLPSRETIDRNGSTDTRQ